MTCSDASWHPSYKETVLPSRKNEVLDLLLKANSKFIHESDVEYRLKEKQTIIYRQCEKNHTARSTNERVPRGGLAMHTGYWELGVSQV